MKGVGKCVVVKWGVKSEAWIGREKQEDKDEEKKTFLFLLFWGFLLCSYGRLLKAQDKHNNKTKADLVFVSCPCLAFV